MTIVSLLWYLGSENWTGEWISNTIMWTQRFCNSAKEFHIAATGMVDHC